MLGPQVSQVGVVEHDEECSAHSQYPSGEFPCKVLVSNSVCLYLRTVREKGKRVFVTFLGAFLAKIFGNKMQKAFISTCFNLHLCNTLSKSPILAITLFSQYNYPNRCILDLFFPYP